MNKELSELVELLEALQTYQGNDLTSYRRFEDLKIEDKIDLIKHATSVLLANLIESKNS